MTGGVFAGRAVVIVGGAGGIGSVTAERFAEAGASVAVLDVVDPPATTAAAVAYAGRIDLLDERSVTAAFDAATAAIGGLDVVVNAAGILRIETVLETTLEAWNTVMGVNATGAFLVLREAGARMLAAGTRGRIISIASMAAKAGGADEVAYAASKAAVVAMTRVAAIEWGHAGITVNSVCPGYIPTGMGSDTRTDEDVLAWSALSPLGRLGTPDDVAGPILHLASDAAAYCTGQAINVTGGMVMH